MQHKLYFISGMPRSGSTLLANILAQNPKFHTTPTSGCLDVIFGVRNSWDSLVEHKASPCEKSKIQVMKGILQSYYEHIERPVIFDKGRGWIAHIEMLENILGEKAKILCPVRDLRDILSSFEKIWRRVGKNTQMSQEKNFYFNFQTIPGRAQIWMREDQPVGLAFNRIFDVLNRGLRDRLHFVHFERLAGRPRETMAEIYEFLGEQYFEHDFNNVEQYTKENDEVHGIVDLHKINPKVEPIPPQYPSIMGVHAEKFKGPYPWDNASAPAKE